MKGIEFKEQNVVFAKDQKEYAPLPAHGQHNGIVTFCMELTPAEVKKIRERAYVDLTVMNFNRAVQPMSLWTAKPEFPIPFDLKLNANPSRWDKEKGTATFTFHFTEPELKDIKKHKKLWITVVTFGSPLQPINQSLN